MCDKHRVCYGCFSIFAVNSSWAPYDRHLSLCLSSVFYVYVEQCVLQRITSGHRVTEIFGYYVGTVRCSEGAGTDARGRNTLRPPSEEQNHTRGDNIM